MQEEVENRSVTLIISTTKLTARVLRAAIARYLAHRKEKKITKARTGPVVPHGKQTVKELVGQNTGVSNMEITDSNIKSFDRVARKYGVDYAVKKDRSVSPPKYLVFFKARDADALTAAMGQNYLRSLFALGFQGFLIIVCVAIYAVLVQNISVNEDVGKAIWTCMP